MASSSRPDPYDDLPTPKRVKTASTSLPSSSSSSASTPKLKWTYDVFLSFRGEDTRNNFVDHLFMNLTQKGINTFRDDEKLERGREISGDLLKAIEESRFAIIIFSENYASSSWCLDELVKIIDCTKETGQIAYPVFYNVDPSDVRKQEGSFAKAFDEHVKKKETWKKALSQAGSLSGWDTRGRHEAEIIQVIVENIFNKLDYALLHVDDNLVGMEVRMEEISTLLNLGSNDVKFVGIHGLGGIGKTTTAKVIYNLIYKQFEGYSYLANVKGSNLVSLQNQLLYEILKAKEQIFNDDSGSSIIQARLNNKKVLIILDDVDNVNQLEKLAGNGKWFGPGSIIIITTRDQHLLNKYEGVQRYEVKECDQDKSLEIFSWKAFKQNHPREDYMELSNEVVDYAEGLPLALTVLGSHLCGRSIDAWRGAIEELKIIPNEEITEILKISYKGLTLIQKDVFLDIACFFNGQYKEEVMEKLDSFGFFPSINLQVLIDKSLITVSATNELMMHDLVRDMGQHIVREKSPQNPEKWSRLWNTKDILQVLENNMGSKAIEGIQLSPPVIRHDFKAQVFKAEVFKKMKNLRFLSYQYQRFLGSFELVKQFSEGLISFSNKLKILEWEKYPCEHLALDFPLHKLVHLSLTNNFLKSLWNGKQVLPQLKFIDLYHSRHLREFPDVTGLPNLELLSLRSCYWLVEIHPSVWVHKGLKFLDLRCCWELESFPNKIEMESLEDLDLNGCGKMKEFPEVHGNMKRLSGLLLGYTAIKELPSSIENFTPLKFLSLASCKNLVCLPSSICKLKYLVQLDFYGSSGLKLPSFYGLPSSLIRLNLGYCDLTDETFPSNIECLSSLEELDLSRNNFVSLPASITQLPRLTHLNLSFCKRIKSIASFYGLPSSLTELDLGYCDLTDETFPSNIECLSSLKTLDLRGNNFVSLPANITQLPLLTELNLSNCKRIKSITSF